MPWHGAVCDHAAVCVENHIMVFGGIGDNDGNALLHNIWMYNMHTQQWGKHMIPRGKIAPPGTRKFCAVAIEGDIYMFGGWDYEEKGCTNAVWRLTRTPEKCLEWRKGIAKPEDKAPSPRHSHSGWEYKGQLWTFGGKGLPLAGYLSDHGDFWGNENNQLLRYDPLSEDWRNLKPSGTIPDPRSGHVTTIIGDTVWVYGGHEICDEFYHLNIVSLIWTEIQFGQLKPPYRVLCSLTAITENQIVLHGGDSAADDKSLNDTWIFDVSSLSWKKYEARKSEPRSAHSGNACTNSGVIIIGGKVNKCCYRYLPCKSPFYVRLEPKTLQQRAIQIIYYHRCVSRRHQRRDRRRGRHHRYDRDVLQLLPNSLKTLFLFPVDTADRQMYSLYNT